MIGVLLLFLVSCYEPNAVERQAAPPMELARVELVGAKRFTPAHVTTLSGLTIGKSVTIDELNAAAQRLANTGFFEEVKYRYTLAGRRATVVYELREIPWTIPVSFDNFVWFTKDEIVAALQRELPTFDGTLPKSHEMPDRTVRALQQLLESRKIPGRVEFSPEMQLESSQILQYLFSVKDPAPKLCAVHIGGAQAIPEKELVESLRSGSGPDYSGFSIGNLVKGTLIHMYRRRGYWRASFAPPATALSEADGCSGVALTLSVAEGLQYAFAGVQWAGNTAVPSAQLEAVFGMKPGDLAEIDKVEAGQRAARREYGRQGYLAMRSSYTPRPDDATRRVAFDIQVTEGPQFRMGTFEVIGLPPTDIDALTKKWRLRAGEPYDEEYAREFSIKEVIPLGRGRPKGAKPPQMQTQVDPSARVVNVRIVVQP